MKETAHEVIVLAIFLAVIGIVFGIYKSGLITIGKTAEQTSTLNKVQEENLVFDKTKNTVKGSDVISAIRYYKNDTTVKITVTKGGVTKTYIAENYNQAAFNIPLETKFHAAYTYTTEQKLQSIEYQETP